MQHHRFLLLQARRPGDPMARHEQECFARALQVPVDRVTPFDLLSGVPGEEDLDAHPLLLVGGSGSYSTLDDDPWIKDFLNWLSSVVVARGLPTFASCFGFQSLVLAGGGAMMRDPDHAEVGTFEIRLTEAGCADALLGACAPSFPAQLGHKDRATRLGAGMVHLASSERAPFQAFRLEGSSIVATQFHPELDREANIYRYKAYQAAYQGSSADDLDAILQGMRPSHKSTALLHRWVEEVEQGLG